MIWLAAGLALARDPEIPEGAPPLEVPEAAPVAEAPSEAPPIAEPLAEPGTDRARSPDAVRLLGPSPDPAPRASALVPPGRPGLLEMWPLALAAAGAGLLWLARRQARGGISSQHQLVVVGRASLGGSASLVLVDVAQPGGGTRRLVVAAGGGTPALLADLGDDGAEPEVAALPAVSAPRADPYAAAAALASPRPDRKAAAMALIDEVVGTRRAARP